ncbi:MAG: hypothetical protein JSS55_03915, partial [Proteobacteria bacterium]|nr:hypothetical protein [Pseudomonadota bacterium]
DREDVFKSIQRISLDFPEIRVIASTRPEIDIRPWEHFTAYKVCGLSLDQAKLLISKIDYPENLKKEFSDLLNTQFYKKHETFLSVPLLCTLMLLTFNEYHEIPSRVTVFYEQAFETLFRKHDTSKEGFFKRTFSSNLSSDRFRTLFSAFCYRTLAFNQVSFSDDSLRNHLRKSAEICEIDVNIDDYASDLVSSICMLMRDGLNLHFIHRSFQDYFAALYILRYRGPDTFEVYDRVITDFFISNIVEMAADIDLQTLEREWALPALKKIDGSIKRRRKADRAKYLLKNMFFQLKVSGSPPCLVAGWSWTTDQVFMKSMSSLTKMYPDYEKLIGLGAYRAQIEQPSSLCDLKNDVEMPVALLNLCETGEYPTDEDFVEIQVDKMPFEWLDRTPFRDKVEGAICSISQLHNELKDKVKTRDRISILD